MVTRRKCILFALLTCLVAPTGASLPFQFERNATLVGDGCTDLKWTVDREALKITLQWKSEVGAEWTAFGISEYGGMKGADIAVVKFGGGDNGGFQVEDRFSTEYGLPKVDFIKNVKLLEAHHDDEGRIQATIERNLFTCDEEDIDIAAHQQYIICASGYLAEDQDMLYHGPDRATGVVNFMINEELLFQRKLVAPPADAPKTYLGDGMVVHGNLDAAVTPLPLDIQMNNISLDSNVSTHYVCEVFNISKPITYTAYEAVWGEGNTGGDGDRNEFLHHQHFFFCPQPPADIVSHMDGQPWDCLNNVPACDIIFGYAVGQRLVEGPPGLHADLNAGIHVLLVHYENPFGKPIVNESTGFRLWIQPPSLDSAGTQPGQIASHGGLFQSLVIPADPIQKEVTLQLLISAEATKEFLPRGGVQAMGSLLHMHKLGTRGRVSLIRNGTHIMDVYNHKSYDYARQSADSTRWRFLPGDALIISCTYRPLVDRDVVGGYSVDDEMCHFYVGWAPAVPNYGRPMGVYVREGEPFKNTPIGNNITVNANQGHLPYSDFKYPPTPKSSHDFVQLSDHRRNICKPLLMEMTESNTITYGDPAVYAQLVAIAAFVGVTLLSSKKFVRFLGIHTCDLRERRNAVVYLGELMFSTVALPIVCMDLASIYKEDATFNGVDPDMLTISRGLIMTQAVLYLMELFYRIDVRWSLVLHHITTLCTMMYLIVVAVVNFSLLAFKFGMALIILAMSEQPLYIVLLLRLTGFRETHRSIWPRLCHIACFLFVASRVVVVILVVNLLVQQSGSSDIAWAYQEVSFSEWAPSSPFFTDPRAVNAVLIILLVAILFSNFFAVAAMLHMAKPPRSVSITGSHEITEDDILNSQEKQSSMSSGPNESESEALSKIHGA
ncbi:DBH-like monooxygenase protein 2 homolog [Seminavis robusta]|uniref:DBH-like monooxygenase protein 2 homolog n=1 Tax=Seminavis robusta TaxID=568900 RepID=A0A9N8ECW2_9STRA|nr:DBH-like monooxygenase protein 2 homolog [Seminavis robusta]|eukprot:Sro812_g206050.1 DBH-like monooxygenase protein 2 homolog (892) ;mRNA; f:17333-20008